MDKTPQRSGSIFQADRFAASPAHRDELRLILSQPRKG